MNLYLLRWKWGRKNIRCCARCGRIYFCPRKDKKECCQSGSYSVFYVYGGIVSVLKQIIRQKFRRVKCQL